MFEWKVSNAKLTKEKVIEIKKLIKQGKRNKDIAKIFSISEATISNIKNGITWTFVK